MKFELEETLRGSPDETLLEDMRRCAKAIGRDTVTIAEYGEIGLAHPSTIQRRFGSWPTALALAGLRPSRSKIGITDEELFENIKSLWITLGRQPKYDDLKAPGIDLRRGPGRCLDRQPGYDEEIASGSQYSVKTYENRFGSWSKALREFVTWVNSDAIDQPQQDAEPVQHASDSTIQIGSTKRRTRREISGRQRFRILIRDGLRCTTCGASPLERLGVELHVDHVIPWSKGGETIDDNLTAKCTQCNLGKGNAFNV